MPQQTQQLARLLKVLSVGTRLQIVNLLKGRALCVNALAGRLDVTQGAVSQHLRVLRDAGLVTDRKCGFYVHYQLNEKTLAKWRRQINQLLETPTGAGKTKKGPKPCAAAMKTKKAARNPKT